MNNCISTSFDNVFHVLNVLNVVNIDKVVLINVWCNDLCVYKVRIDWLFDVLRM